MTDPDGGQRTGRGKAIAVHLTVVGFTFALSTVLLPLIVPFDPEGAAGTTACCGVMIGSAAAAVVGLLIRRPSVWSCAVVFAIAFSCTGSLSVEAVKDWRYMRYQAPYDRFRDNLVSPIPGSVTNLRFVSLEDDISPNLTFRFDIAPDDLGAILAELKMERVDPQATPNPKDFFQYPYYLPIDGPEFHLYQGKDRYGNVLTIKTNETHSHAIFRREDSRYYQERGWEKEPEVDTRRHDEALKRMKQRYEAAQKKRGEE